jgi:multicomponent Na+:H+ antiporter subunit D
MADWPIPLGIGVRADGLSAVFLVLVAVVTLASCVQAWVGADQSPALWPLMLLTVAGLNAVFVAADLFNAYVGLEVIGLASVGLVALGGRSALAAALRYLLIAVVGSLLFLVMVAIVYGATGTLDMRLAGELWPGTGLSATAPLGLAAVGLGLKCALFPMHGWLPSAHAGAPGAVSPVLSALVVKAPIVLLFRLWFELFGPDLVIATVLGILGASAVFWGGIQALLQSRLKRIVAYSTIAQVGYLFLIFPLTQPGVPEQIKQVAISAVVTLAVSHGLAKAALFLCAGTLLRTYGTDELTALPGTSEAYPPLLLAMGLAAVSLMGLPISAGFTGKWQLLSAATSAGVWWIVVVVVAGTLLSAAYLMRPLAAGLAEPKEHREYPRLGWAQQVAPLLLVVITTVLGLRSVELVELTLIGWGGL